MKSCISCSNGCHPAPVRQKQPRNCYARGEESKGLFGINMDMIQHVCPKPAHGMMPFIIHDAAVKGRQTEVLTWLENGGDINAADMNDQTLVFIACENGHVQLLKELLKHPKVHLNQYGTQIISDPNYRGAGRPISPMTAACNKGHSDCIEALIQASAECQADLRQALSYGHLKREIGIFKIALKKGFVIEEWNVFQNFLDMAIMANDSDFARDIIQKDIPQDIPQDFSPTTTLCFISIFQAIDRQNMWESTGAEELFGKALSSECDSIKKVLLLALEKKDWKRLETLLNMMIESVKLNVSLSEAILEKMFDDVERLLAEEEMEADVMNGALLVSSIGGTSEQIASLLLSQKYTYSSKTLDNVLILSCLNNRLELLPTLLQRETFSYKTLDRAKMVIGIKFNIGMMQERIPSGAARLVERALQKAAEEIIPLDQDEEKNLQAETSHG